MAAVAGEERHSRRLRRTRRRRPHPWPGPADLARCHREGGSHRVGGLVRGLRRDSYRRRGRGTPHAGSVSRG